MKRIIISSTLTLTGTDRNNRLLSISLSLSLNVIMIQQMWDLIREGEGLLVLEEPQLLGPRDFQGEVVLWENSQNDSLDSRLETTQEASF